MREPYSCIAYIAARTPLPKLLNIKHPDCDCESLRGEDYGKSSQPSSLYVACSKCNLVWTAWMICEGLLYCILLLSLIHTLVSIENLQFCLVASCRKCKLLLYMYCKIVLQRGL